MKLSHLVHYLNFLDQHDSSRTLQEHSAFANYVSNMFEYISACQVQFPGVADRIKLVQHDIDQARNSFDQSIAAMKNLIKSHIEIWEPTYFQTSYKFYQRNCNLDPIALLDSQKIDLDTKCREHLISRLVLYGNWQHAGMIIRPYNESWIQNLTALDPLYLVDTNHDLLTNCLDVFPQEYQSRVRKYIIPSDTFYTQINPLLPMTPDQPLPVKPHAEKIPQSQMGLIFCYNFFNYTPLDYIIEYLAKLQTWLKPGGTAIFTFNNCDKAGAVELVENDSACYTPGRLLYAALSRNNWNIHYTFDVNSAVTWVEMTKPGTLASARGGQALARPVAKATRNQ